jgi:hypothetical protein
VSNGLAHEGQYFLCGFKVFGLVSADHESQGSGRGCVYSTGDWSVDEDGTLGLGSFGHGAADGWINGAAVDEERSGLKRMKSNTLAYLL